MAGVGLQVLGWVLGGLVMTAIPIERVRGEHHAAAFQPMPLPTQGLVGYAAAALTLPVVITGLILLWIRLGRDLKGVLARRRRAG